MSVSLTYFICMQNALPNMYPLMRNELSYFQKQSDKSSDAHAEDDDTTCS